MPKHAHSTMNLTRQISFSGLIINAAQERYDSIVDRDLLVRRIKVTANKLVDEASAKKSSDEYRQYDLDLFTDYEVLKQEQVAEERVLEGERKM